MPDEQQAPAGGAANANANSNGTPNNSNNSTSTTGNTSNTRNNNNNNNNNNNDRNNNRNSDRNNNNNTNKKFTGATSDLNGHVFQTTAEYPKSNQFNRTIEELTVYASKEYKDSIIHLTKLFEELQTPTVAKPAPLPADADEIDKKGQEYEIKQWCEDKRKLNNTLRSVYNVIWGQCSSNMQAKLRATKDFQQMKDDGDAAKLLREIKGISHQFESNQFIYDALDEARRKLYIYFQQPNDSNVQHLKTFRNLVEVFEHYGGEIGTDPGLVEYEKERNSDVFSTLSYSDYVKICKNRMVGIMFLRRADRKRYEPLLTKLSNEYTFKRDNYPTSLDDAFDMLQNFKIPKTYQQQGGGGGGNGGRGNGGRGNGGRNGGRGNGGGGGRSPQLQFVQQQDLVPGTNGNVFARIQCNRCQKWGHYATHCPDGSSSQHFMDFVDMEALDFAASESDSDSDAELFPHYTFTHHIEHQLAHSPRRGEYSPFDILLDTGSSCSVFNNNKLLTDIHRCRYGVRAYTNGGHQDSNLQGNLPGFFPVWYNPKSILNILSYSEVAQHFRITTDSAETPSIFVHVADGATLEFKLDASGLYIFDASSYLNGNKEPIFEYKDTFASTTVRDNKANFTRREIQGADDARELYTAIGMPSYRRFFWLLSHRYFRDCPLTIADAKRALTIYGREIATLKGKDTRQRPSHIPGLEPMPIPPIIYDSHKHITLCIDFFFVQGLPFFHSISRGYKFRTTEAVANRYKSTILTCINTIRKKYEARALELTDIHGDGEFEDIKDELGDVKVHIAPPNHHIGEVERSIRVQKERVRCSLHGLPYRRYPKAMIEGCLYNAVNNLNNIPSDDGVSKFLSPNCLINDTPPPSYKTLTEMKFGDYTQVFEGSDNSENARTVGAIALYPSSGDNKPGRYFMSLATGKRIHRGQWHEPLPIPDDVIDRVHQLAEAEGMPPLRGDNFTFSWTDNQAQEQNFDQPNENVYEIDGNVAIATPDEDEGADIPYVEAQGAEDEGARAPPANDTGGAIHRGDQENEEENENNSISENEEAEHSGTEAIHEEAENNVEATIQENMAPAQPEIIVETVNEEEDDDLSYAAEDETTETEISEQDDNTEEQMSFSDNEENNEHDSSDSDSASDSGVDTDAATRGTRLRSGRILRRQQFSQMVMKNPPQHRKNKPATSSKKVQGKLKPKKMKKLQIKDTFKHVVRVLFNQMSAKVGIKKHGQVAINAILKEYAQLDDLEVFKLIDVSTLTKEQKDMALRLITVIKEKRNGIIKGRACADGRPQRKYISKEESTAPAVSLESLILSILTDAMEGNDVATADVAGAFLKGLMEDFVLIKLRGEEVDIICDVNEQYKSQVIYENGVKVLYLQLNKALYGCMKSAIIWYETFVTTLSELGFKLNPYDPCVANKTVNGSLLTICWYVDDTKMSHKDSKVVDWLIEEIEKRHGKMTVTRGKKHTFVGMDIEFLGNKRVSINTKEYIVECFDTFGEDIAGPVTSPATRDLFMVDEKSDKLNEDKSDRFHSIVAKLLYVCRRSRLDVSLMIAFLCTRVSCSTVQDWEKLRRLLRYLKCTIDMPRILSADSFDMLHTWVDAAYATHMNMRSHTGGVMSFGGLGVLNAKSAKQRINVKSSTEAEVVGASDYLPWVIWVNNFMKYQGYTIKNKIFYQDNMSAIKMENNGIASCSERSRHIDIRYFFIKDVIRRENIEIKHCPTEVMIADFFTKPLQGNLFRKMRDYIMGANGTLNEERVGTRNLEGENNTSKVPLNPERSWAEIVKGNGEKPMMR